MVRWITRDIRSRNCILENSWTHWSFKAGKPTSRLKYVQFQYSLYSPCIGPRSRDSKINGRSCDIVVDYRAERDFTDCEMFDAKIASALKRTISSAHFRRRVSVEEQRAQKDDRFVRGSQIPYMMYEYFRATRAHEAVQGLSDLIQYTLTR